MVRITVYKKHFYPELADDFLTDGREVGPCPILEEGQVYHYDGGAEKPEGLCPWAWIDIYKQVAALYSGGGNQPWYKESGQAVACCTDGVRPVIFILERLPS